VPGCWSLVSLPLPCPSQDPHLEQSEILDSSLDYRATLESVARMAVPEIADWCSISMLNERNEMYRLAVAHPDPVKHRLAQELTFAWRRSSLVVRQ
jgi:hypothetical protein